MTPGADARRASRCSARRRPPDMPHLQGAGCVSRGRGRVSHGRGRLSPKGGAAPPRGWGVSRGRGHVSRGRGRLVCAAVRPLLPNHWDVKIRWSFPKSLCDSILMIIHLLPETLSLLGFQVSLSQISSLLSSSQSPLVCSFSSSQIQASASLRAQSLNFSVDTHLLSDLIQFRVL